MNFTRSSFARRAAFAILVVFGAALPQFAVAQNNPLAGTWKFIPEKSTFTPGPAPYREMTLKFPDAGPPVMTAEGVDARGNPVKASFTAVVDGNPHPVTGMPAFNSGMWTRSTDAVTTYRYMKGNSIAVLGIRAVSADGKTLTFREQTYDDKGKQTAVAVMVFENPDVKVASVTPNAPAAAAAAPAAPQTVLSPAETEAAAALAKGDDDQAMRLLTAIIEAPKATPMLYFDYVSRGVVYARKGDQVKAMADFDAAIKLKPNDADAHYRRGGILVQQKQYQAAIDELSIVIQEDPMNGPAYSLRSFSHYALSQNADGAADTDKACALNKEFCVN